MIRAGQVVLFEFPRTDLQTGKFRPALVLRALPGPYDDWLLCMISSQIRHAIPNFDDAIGPRDRDFSQSGLKTESVIRIGRVAVVEEAMMVGAIGAIDEERLRRVRKRLSDWLRA